MVGYAQEPSKTPAERADTWTSWMKTELSLSPEQEVPVHAINLKYASLNEEIRTSADSRLSKLNALKTNDQNKDSELQKILTKGQFATYQERKSEVRQRIREQRGR